MKLHDYKKVKKLLIRALGAESVIDDTDILESYARDETSDLSARPDIVVRAAGTGDISETMKICERIGVPVIPRGAGTGVTGGAVAVSGGVVLSLERMNRIIEIDEKNMVALVEPGVITGDLQKAAQERGLMYPPDPGSLDSCTIGGNVAEGAGGPRAVKYGTTKDYVLGMEFVLSDGRVISTGGKFVKNATGYNLAGILVGSEGTLAVITKIYLRLIPAPPCILDLLIPYDSVEAAIDDAFKIISNKIIPSALEFMEEDAIRIAVKHLGGAAPFPEARAHLLVQIDGISDEALRADSDKILSCISRSQDEILASDNRHTSERIWKTRRAIREAITAESAVFLAEDTVVPRSQIPFFIREVKEYLTAQGLRSLMFGHAGDGNVHIDVLKGELPYGDWKKMVPRLKKTIYGFAISCGGTITGEHGIGHLRREFLPMALSPDEIDLMKRIKSAFDPQHILNPHKAL